MAMGGNTFQAGYLTHALHRRRRRARDLRPLLRLADGTPDAAVFDEPGSGTRSSSSAGSPAQADEGWVNRQWNDTTNTVIPARR